LDFHSLAVDTKRENGFNLSPDSGTSLSSKSAHAGVGGVRPGAMHAKFIEIKKCTLTEHYQEVEDRHVANDAAWPFFPHQGSPLRGRPLGSAHVSPRQKTAWQVLGSRSCELPPNVTNLPHGGSFVRNPAVRAAWLDTGLVQGRRRAEQSRRARPMAVVLRVL